MTPVFMFLQSTSYDALTDDDLKFQERINWRGAEEALPPPCQGSIDASRQGNHHTLLMCYLLSTLLFFLYSLFTDDLGNYILYTAVCITLSVLDNKFSDACQRNHHRDIKASSC